MANKKKTTGERLFGQEFLDSEQRLFRKLPKRWHSGVKDLLNKLQLWDMRVFLNIERRRAAHPERKEPKP